MLGLHFNSLFLHLSPSLPQYVLAVVGHLIKIRYGIGSLDENENLVLVRLCLIDRCVSIDLNELFVVQEKKRWTIKFYVVRDFWTPHVSPELKWIRVCEQLTNVSFGL